MNEPHLTTDWAGDRVVIRATAGHTEQSVSVTIGTALRLVDSLARSIGSASDFAKRSAAGEIE